MKGKDQYGSPPCTNKFRSAPFYIDIIIYLFLLNKQGNEKVNCTLFIHCYGQTKTWAEFSTLEAAACMLCTHAATKQNCPTFS
jgi:hypothetical protein